MTNGEEKTRREPKLPENQPGETLNTEETETQSKSVSPLKSALPKAHKDGATLTRKTVVTLDSLTMEIGLSGQINAAPQIISISSGKVEIAWCEPKEKKNMWGRFLEGLKDYVPLFSTILSIVASIVLGYAGYLLNKQQFELSERQAKENKEASDRSFITEFNNKLGDLAVEIPSISLKTNKERKEVEEAIKKKSEAATWVALNWEKSLPALRPILGSDSQAYQEAAIIAFNRMYRSQSIKPNDLVSKLLEYFRDGNSDLRGGVLKCFLTFGDDLSKDHLDLYKKITEVLKEKYGPNAERCHSENQQVISDVIKFWGIKPDIDCKNFLLGVLANPSSADAQLEAISRLPRLAIDMPDNCIMILSRLREAFTSTTHRLIVSGSTESSAIIKANFESAINAIERNGCK